MTAHESTSAGSENSVSRGEDRVLPLAHDPALRRIVEHAATTGGATTRRNLAAKTGWSVSAVDVLFERLEAEECIEQVGDPAFGIVVLTHRGELLARGDL